MDKAIRQNTKILFLLKGLLFSYIITAFILLLLSFLMLKFDLSSLVISGGINFAYILSNFLAGFYVGKKAELRKFVWGIVMGVMYFVILMLISLIMNRVSPIPLGGLLTVLIMCGLSGMLGGMIS
ncbi:MAG TPA: TIGR04086 family membrane protein [Lachnospiraceae bacterium]|jgi:putative membrane protein (TIGR04086 family)|nr:TIGR04086 family membrane protein [Lachnospiraceae bacterium]HBI74645.1 TIGR04086 family membrane protein [Lachnospiraceae bacterium]HBY71084.1 TIGR04086 family membrane protein [Lachnospiraceae bacterium]HCA69685.1 TIGR04086 family membrane protein [Lachnospiraceae bacterium]HCM12574.1 TIGR04086 family membrane protein [Lachnospiraceae bacterium]